MGLSDINLCDHQKETPLSTDISLCDQQGAPTDIRICNDIDPCEQDMILLGFSQSSGALISSGASVTISGGVAPYAASYSNGAADMDGDAAIITFENCSEGSGDDAWGTLTITDSCGTIATRDFRHNVSGAKWCCLAVGGAHFCENTGVDIRTDCEDQTFGSCTGTGNFSHSVSPQKYEVGAYRYWENGLCYFTPKNCPESRLDGVNPCGSGKVYLTAARWVLEWRCE